VEPLLRERDREAAERNATARAMLAARGGHSESDPMPFIVGVPRSGTTLLRTMLDGHPSLSIPMETGFLPSVFDLAWETGVDPDRVELRTRFQALLTGFPTWEYLGVDADDFRQALSDLEHFDLTRGLRAFYRLCAGGKPRAGDKTPSYARHLPVVEALLPESHFIHLVRDGRDVYVSARDAPWTVARHWFPFGRDPETLAAQWRRDILLCRRLAVSSARFLEVRYEDLVADPAAQLDRICRFIALPYEEAMLRYHERGSGGFRERAMAALEGFLDADPSHGPGREEVDAWVQRFRMGVGPIDLGLAGRWRRDMDDAEIEAFEAVAGDVLARYDYELRRPAPTG
jgi:hypothetical protein